MHESSLERLLTQSMGFCVYILFAGMDSYIIQLS